MIEGVAEILKRVSKIHSRKGKIEELRKSHNPTFETIVDITYNPRFWFVLPEGTPPYTPLEKRSDAQGALYGNIRLMNLFLNTIEYENTNPLVRETRFVAFLEMLDPDDAELILHIKNHREIPYKGITRKLFEEAWPALASTWVENG